MSVDVSTCGGKFDRGSGACGAWWMERMEWVQGQQQEREECPPGAAGRWEDRQRAVMSGWQRGHDPSAQ
jgi:hypothetical protein